MNTTFNYKKASPILYRGCAFDSLLELKFALSLEDNYSYIREPFIIGYDEKTLRITTYLREGTNTYRPDFLIRSKAEPTKAFLIEIKPNAYKHCRQVQYYHYIEEQYLTQLNKAYIFKMVYEENIFLNPAQHKKFNLLVANKNTLADCFAFQKLDRNITVTQEVIIARCHFFLGIN